MKNLNRHKAQEMLKMAGIIEPPVDVNKVAKILGFKVVPYPFPDKRKGIVHIENGLKVIGVNEKHSLPLQRFTVAHEIGHYLSGHQQYQDTFVDDESRFFEPSFHQEKEADSFASELLMPKEFLEKDLEKHGLDINKLKELYQVSEQALWIRLTSLRLAEKYSGK